MEKSLWIKIGLFLIQIPEQWHLEINKETENTQWNLPGETLSEMTPCPEVTNSILTGESVEARAYLHWTSSHFFYRRCFLCHLYFLGCAVGISDFELNEHSICLRPDFCYSIHWHHAVSRTVWRAQNSNSTLSQRWVLTWLMQLLSVLWSVYLSWLLCSCHSWVILIDLKMKGR